MIGRYIGRKIGIKVSRGGVPFILLLYDLRDMSLSSQTIDEHLIYLASIDTMFKIIDIRGNEPRTSASDAAVLELTTTLNNELWEDE